MHFETGPGEFFTAFPGDGVVFAVLAIIAIAGILLTIVGFQSRVYEVGLFFLTATLAVIGSLLWFITGSAPFTHTFGTMDSLTFPILQIGVIAFYASGLSLVVTVVYTVHTVLEYLREVKLRRELRTK